MPAFRLLADLNISPLSIAILRRHGWDVIRASERLPPTASDREILVLARHEGRTVLTADLDFSTLVALSGHSQPSLITMRLSSSDPQLMAERLLEAAPLLQSALTDGCAVTIDDSKTVRIRKLPI
jgi:predicted nuclease of predicted toxin-antitoxin system